MAARRWLDTRVVERKEWNDKLATFVLDADIGPFKPGQFADLALEAKGQRVSRSYSIASAPGQPLEFFVAYVEDGTLTPSLFDLAPGDALQVRAPAAGTFTLDRIPPCRHLWLVATGTGLAPYVSMWRASGALDSFERVVVVHGVRYGRDMAYADELRSLASAQPERIRVVHALTRDPTVPGVLHGRITDLLRAGELERAVGLRLDPADSHVMLCGNPAMIKEMASILEERGLRRNTHRTPGQFSFEAYW